ncbi:hypothetical protein PspLS_07777 [Pyricularia sp. CBS 133598]|nr:hypothetical protein PspLS_07777 [Pyricularia sp. CBS 133598]
MSAAAATFARTTARPVFRSGQIAAQARAAFRQQQWKQHAGRRWQSSAAPEAEANPSWFKRMWDSPIGIKTVHFWAPVMKWAVVLAGVSDFFRPAEKLSLTQNAALTATGFIWTRWCLIIKPKNYLLAAVNFFLGIVGTIQVSRILMFQASQKDAILPAVEEKVEEVKDAVKSS